MATVGRLLIIDGDSDAHLDELRGVLDKVFEQRGLHRGVFKYRVRERVGRAAVVGTRPPMPRVTVLEDTTEVPEIEETAVRLCAGEKR